MEKGGVREQAASWWEAEKGGLCWLGYVIRSESGDPGNILKGRARVRICFVERAFVYLESPKNVGSSEAADKVVVVY